ncbi:HEAT repeat-containing protein 1 [Rhinatrema bivittatum]|uniref:HEAT repeat-containing protein 1 n=1 Tax=Rhinatrema bivittatum TaxID=194408 RepID=UPI001126A5B1|nr:HEAT repeat-containing protein 1 [Rhinatrema bivittatum]XP_029449671.1 HEAT repeat-containing protein 1 [Rhinatrema bivittatum]XP_029449672.1 HEAT repeat-containing protein 1 [Rhinatrema bivittatum]XP_029449673.1 HEAT repeat-containing protein 1 [Rhinatrema bivittatum]XP_029449674.1 HEAT repeat-containing protein 1 [Rhinatrema bivittatum]XP_029449675.1 HEAT repeat-containing protein 1 [Rhinatrema bivittatum]
MTSLAHQLKRLALPQNDPSLLVRRETASLLFDCKEAANIDRDTFFAIGCTGLEELMGIDPSFETFQGTLFSHASKSLERSVQTKAANQQLDENIALFLTRLSPYFMLKPAQKCLEWLIHRFHIHLYNQDSLVGCVLPYHETRVFVRVIQLLKINDPTHKWNWLEPIQKPGVPLARGTLITHCYKDLGFMDFICNLVTKAVKAFAENSGSVPQLRVLFSFYASTVVATMDAAEKILDPVVAKLLPYIQKGLKSSLVDYKAATYMIICQLAVKVVMEASLVQSLTSQISRTLTRTPSLLREGLGCLVVLLQSQKTEGLGKKPFHHLCDLPDLVPLLQGMAVAYDITALLRYLLPDLARAVIYHPAGEATSEEVDSDVFTRQLEAILTCLPLEKDLARLLASTFLEEFITYGTENSASSEEMSELKKRLLSLIRLLERKYPTALDLVLEEGLKAVSGGPGHELFHQFLSLSTSGGKYQFLAESDTSLLLSLNHPRPAIRRSAVWHLTEIMRAGKEGFDESFVREALLTRLLDEDIDVVLSALGALEVFHEQISPEDRVTSLLSLFEKVDLSADGRWYHVLEKVTDILMKEQALAEDEQLANQAVRKLLPFLTIINNDLKSAEQKMAIYLAKSGFCSLHPLLKGWPEALEKVLKSSKSGLLDVMNGRLIQVLAENLTSADPSAISHMVTDLLHVVEDEQTSMRQKVTFLVASNALVQGFSSSRLGENHMKVALRIFSLLKRKLRSLMAHGSAEETPTDWLINAVPEDPLPKELLTEYVLRLTVGQGAETAEAALVAILLRDFVGALTPPDSFTKGKRNWNPEILDEASRDYLLLLVDLFEVIVSGADEGNNVANFRQLMSILLKVHLEDPADLLGFLSILWTYNYSLSDPLGCTVPAILQTRALYIGQVVLASQAPAKRKQLASVSSPVVISVLANLQSPVREVRRAAMGCLQSLNLVKESPFHPVVQSLLQTTEEIIADSAYISQALGSLFEDLQISSNQKSSQKLSEALRQLLDCTQAPRCPSYVARVLMKALQEVKSEAVLLQLLPTIGGLLERVGKEPEAILKDEALLLHLLLRNFHPCSAGLLCREPHSLQLFITALQTTKVLHQGLPAIQITALNQITKQFFAAVTDGRVQQKLLGVLFDLLLNCKNPLCAQTVSSVFKGISVNAEQMSLELEPPEKAKSLSTVRQTRRQSQQHRKLQDQEGTAEGGSGVNWQRVTLILELLQHKKKLLHPELLVPTLFNLLSRCLESVPAEQGSLEYTKQLILSCLLNICQKLSPDGSKIPADVLDEERFSVELVVQCVRGSDMPQTHHHALMLLGSAATIFPDKVLHNIMPIFTFMGANIMRLDDTYSFRVISRTVQTVIPALIQADNGISAGNTNYVDGVVGKIIHVFVDALPHVPEHRRVPILAQLVGTVGGERFLWALLVLLFEQHVTRTVTAVSNGEKDALLERDTEFWISVCCEFGIGDQLQSTIKILKYLTKLPQNKDEVHGEQKKSRAQKAKHEDLDEHLFNVASHSDKQLRHFKFLAVSFLAQLLASRSFVGKVVECENAEELQDIEQRLLEEVLCYLKTVAGSVENNADKPTVKFWKALLNKSYELLDKVNALLPTERFIPVIRGLMASQLPLVRRKAMELLNNKLQQHMKWQEAQIRLLLGLVGELLSIVSRKADTEEEEQAINRQTALFSLKLLCRCFGAAEQEAFVPVLSVAVELICAEGHEDRNVMGSALLCVAEVTSVLKALAIPQLPRLMPAILGALKVRKELVFSEIYLLSAVTALQKVLETLPHFLSPYLLDTLLQIACLEKIGVEMGPKSQLNLRIVSLKTTLATKLPSRVLLPTISKCYQELVTKHKHRLGHLMDVLKEHIGSMEKQLLASHQSELTTFFLKALNFRADHPQDDLEEVGITEGHIIDCLITMVMKLSEVTFRPFFFRLFDWCKTEDSSKDRLLTFYRLADRVADKLKGLFTLFAGHLVKPFADLLNQINTVKTDKAFYDSRNTEKSCLLLLFILDCLHKIFLFDTQRFVSKERAEALMMPLVDQLENLLGGDEKFQERVTGHLIPCIAQFSVAMADDSLWKPLNYQILLKMRHASPKVRFAALIALTELAGKLRENYMILLPESIPFLAELMEDECEEVEHQCQKSIQQLEVILGESLQSYF